MKSFSLTNKGEANLVFSFLDAVTKTLTYRANNATTSAVTFGYFRHVGRMAFAETSQFVNTHT
jgi:hypothetical protein